MKSKNSEETKKPKGKLVPTKLYLHVEEDMFCTRIVPAARRHTPETRPVFLTAKQKQLFRWATGEPKADMTGHVIQNDNGRAGIWDDFQLSLPDRLREIPGLKDWKLYLLSPTVFRIQIKRYVEV